MSHLLRVVNRSKVLRLLSMITKQFAVFLPVEIMTQRDTTMVIKRKSSRLGRLISVFVISLLFMVFPIIPLRGVSGNSSNLTYAKSELPFPTNASLDVSDAAYHPLEKPTTHFRRCASCAAATVKGPKWEQRRKWSSAKSRNLQQKPLQPKVIRVEKGAASKSFGSVSMPRGSKWCGGRPTYWLIGEQR